MNLYIVNVSTGWVKQEGQRAVPCDSVIELDERTGADGVKRGLLLPEDSKLLTAEHKEKLAAFKAARSTAGGPLPGVVEVRDADGLVIGQSPVARGSITDWSIEPLPGEEGGGTLQEMIGETAGEVPQLDPSSGSDELPPLPRRHR